MCHHNLESTIDGGLVVSAESIVFLMTYGGLNPGRGCQAG